MLARHRNKPQTRRGDTMIEVMFGMAVFGLVAILSVNLMDNGLKNSQANLELTMARNEINAQAEALRFVHSSYAIGGESSQYADVWKSIIDGADAYSDAAKQTFNEVSSCQSLYTGAIDNVDSKSFVLNLTNISDGIIRGDEHLKESQTFPYISVSTSSKNAYGIWVNAVKGKSDTSVPMYYNFYIHTCWYSPGFSAPSTLDTVVRLYNPKYSRS